MDIDPYAVLAVPKDATLPEIKSAHRKLVLKCHPDKIKDESLRNEAQDQFQRVQQAYELLSDPSRRTKYDQKVRLAELRREMKDQHPYASPRAGGHVREYRDGRIYEERMPADYFDDGFYHSPDEKASRGTSRKHDDYGRRPRAEERRKPRPTTTTSSPFNPFRAAKEAAARDSTKTSHSTRDKSRTKERRREAYEKYENVYVDSDASGYDSEPSRIYVRPSESRKASPDKRSGSSPHKPRSTSTHPATESRRFQPEVVEEEDDEDSDQYETKHDKLHTTARDYIMRSKGNAPIEIDSRQRPSRSPQRPREHTEPPASESARSSATPRAKHSSRESVRPSSSRNSSYEHLEPSTAHPPPPRTHYETFKVPPMPTAATSPAAKAASSATRPTLQPSRSATTAAAYSRSASKRDSTNLLVNMVYADGSSRSSRVRSTDRYDSGYSSPGTPDMHGTSPPKTSTRYKIVTEPEPLREVPPTPPMASTTSRYQRGYSPPRPHPHAAHAAHSHTHPLATPERPSFSTRAAAKPTRSHTTYAPDSRGPRPTSSAPRPLFGQKDKPDAKYAREYGPDDVVYTARDSYNHPHGPPRAYSYDDYQTASRRQPTYA